MYSMMIYRNQPTLKGSYQDMLVLMVEYGLVKA